MSVSTDNSRSSSATSSPSRSDSSAARGSRPDVRSTSDSIRTGSGTTSTVSASQPRSSVPDPAERSGDRAGLSLEAQETAPETSRSVASIAAGLEDYLSDVNGTEAEEAVPDEEAVRPDAGTVADNTDAFAVIGDAIPESLNDGPPLGRVGVTRVTSAALSAAANPIGASLNSVAALQAGQQGDFLGAGLGALEAVSGSLDTADTYASLSGNPSRWLGATARWTGFIGGVAEAGYGWQTAETNAQRVSAGLRLGATALAAAGPPTGPGIVPAYAGAAVLYTTSLAIDNSETVGNFVNNYFEPRVLPDDIGARRRAARH